MNRQRTAGVHDDCHWPSRAGAGHAQHLAPTGVPSGRVVVPPCMMYYTSRCQKPLSPVPASLAQLTSAVRGSCWKAGLGGPLWGLTPLVCELPPSALRMVPPVQPLQHLQEVLLTSIAELQQKALHLQGSLSSYLCAHECFSKGRTPNHINIPCFVAAWL